MRTEKMRKLALAVTAAGFLSAPIHSAALAYEMSAAVVVQNIGAYVGAAQLGQAADLVARLRALGITAIRLGDLTVTLDQLEAALATAGTPASDALLAQLVAVAQTGITGSFIAGTVLIASVDSEQVIPDLFPTGSAG